MEFISLRRMIAVLLFVGMATMLASSPVVAHNPLKYCDFFLKGSKHYMPVLRICPTKSDVVYTKTVGHIMHHIVFNATLFDDAQVLAANSNRCYMSKYHRGPWDETTCAKKFTVLQQWVRMKNLQDDAGQFLNKFIKISITSAQYEWGNFNSKGSPRDCLMIKTGRKYAEPDGPECKP